MKKLSIEEKAKRYDEAIERAKGVIEQNPLMEYLKKGIEYILPELKESEDESIRKEIIEFIKSRGGFKGEWIAWLEKQGELELKLLNNEEYQTVPVETLDRLYAAEKELEKLKQCEQKPAEWSEEDEKMIENIIDTINIAISDCDVDDIGTKARFSLEKERDWLKNKLKYFRPQSAWKPSEEMLEALYRAIPENVMAISEDEMLLDKLYQGLKYGRVLSEK